MILGSNYTFYRQIHCVYKITAYHLPSAISSQFRITKSDHKHQKKNSSKLNGYIVIRLIMKNLAG